METAIGSEWKRLGLRQLSGMLILVYVRSQHLVRSTLPPTFSSASVGSYNQSFVTIHTCNDCSISRRLYLRVCHPSIRQCT